MYGSKRKRRLHSIAVLLGPVSFVLTIVLLEWFFGFKQAAALGTAVWMALWWILRPVNISVTAFVPIAVNALFDLVPMQQIISQYFSEIIVLLFGADLVCLTWATTGLDKRLAIKTLCCIGTSMKQQIAVWLIVSTVLSIFLPNVVVCTIMVPVAVSMLQFLGEGNIQGSKLAVPILLAIVWGAGIGGFGSPLGGAANLVAISYLEKLTGQEFMYIDWVVALSAVFGSGAAAQSAFSFSSAAAGQTAGGQQRIFYRDVRPAGSNTFRRKNQPGAVCSGNVAGFYPAAVCRMAAGAEACVCVFDHRTDGLYL